MLNNIVMCIVCVMAGVPVYNFLRDVLDLK